MTFNDAIKTCMLQKYADFSGRASRSEYWWFWLFYVLAISVAAIINGSQGSYTLNGLIFIIFLLPNLAVTARRLHDVNRSGWWQLLYLTFIGGFIILYWLCKKSVVFSKYESTQEHKGDLLG